MRQIDVGGVTRLADWWGLGVIHAANFKVNRFDMCVNV